MIYHIRRIALRLSLILAVSLLMFGSGSNKAEAQVCNGHISMQDGSWGFTRPSSYYITNTIDGDPSDSEYVFRIYPTWRVDYWRIHWYSWSSTIRNMASSRWGGQLGLVNCSGVTLLYADYLAVLVTGGAEYWKNNVWIWFQR